MPRLPESSQCRRGDAVAGSADVAHRPHLLLAPPWPDGDLAVPAEARHHLERVLRASETPVGYTDGAGRVGSGVYTGGSVRRGEERFIEPRTPRVVVAVAAPHGGDRQRIVVEKLAELGVDELAWLRTRHGGHRVPSPRRSLSWATSALEQSRGAWLMEVRGPVDLESLAAADAVLVAHPGCGPLVVPDAERIVIGIGPEGGFAPGEVADGTMTCFGLGERILRTETAAVAAATLALYLVGRSQHLPDD